jgi:hypothetical protein
MALAAAGYSGTPLPAKFGLKDGMAVAFIALPAELEDLTGCRDFAEVERAPDWASMQGRERAFDAVHAFSRRRTEVEDHLELLQKAITPDGVIWVSWPKKASGMATELTEDVVREAALRLDLVDVKVAAVDAVWSGLKLVIRKDRR